jgi:hypothetical protein
MMELPVVQRSERRTKRNCALDQLFGKTRQVHRTDACGRQELQREVAVADRIQAVRRGPVKAQRLCRHVPVDGKGRPRQGCRAKRAFVHPLAGILEPRLVPRQHLDIGHHVMPPGHRLRGLQMGKARHNPIGPSLGLLKERPHQPGQPLGRLIALVADPQPEIHRHLVVPRPPGVQPLARLADPFGQPGLDVQMDVLQLGGKGELARLDL